jgi:3'(2'), 5'-bisphosphate nucleotidase
MKNKIDRLVEISIEAGNKIMEIYAMPDFTSLIEMKGDQSPLTLADKEAHKVIVQGLESYFPSIPIMSEEGKSIPYEERKNWKQYWCVDPLDGTKEFIKRNGEFTVNIALIENGETVVGVIYIPVKEIGYVGMKGEGAYKFDLSKKLNPIKVRISNDNRIAVGSRSHGTESEKEYYAKHKVVDAITSGSSIKFCMVAEGLADVYYREGPTMEWDTAAGQAIVEAAGGSVTKIDGSVFEYNKENLLNPGFISRGNWIE